MSRMLDPKGPALYDRSRFPMYLRLFISLSCVFVLLFAGQNLSAAPKSFGQADAAWHRGELDEAQGLYQSALDEGGLVPEEVVVAYSRIGTVKAAMRDRAGALSDFRVAAAIDPNFELPADSGTVARELYQQAKDEANAQGERLSLNVEAPKEIPANEAFVIETEIPEGFAVFVTRIVVVLEDTLTGKKWRKAEDASGRLTFKFPPKVAEKGARLKVTISGVDSKENAWVSETLRIRVQGKRSDSGAAPAGPAQSGGWGGNNEDPFATDPKKDNQGDKDSIFAGPVPWIVGGAVLVAAVATIFLVTRSPSEVSVGAPAWQ